ncbi:MAG: glycosyltransferase family 2 protein [Desulfovibrionaceae bacterium]
MRELVSVIIPAYNAAHFIDTALCSVRAQDWPVEAIVVNDGSTDDLAGALRPHAGRVTVIDQENRGLSAARNAGLRRAAGRYVLFLDADDMLGPGVVAGQVAALEAAGGTGVPVCRTRFFSGLDAQGEPEPCGQWRRFPERLDIHVCHFNVAPPLAFLVRRDVALEAGGFDETLGACEDHDFWLRVQGVGHAPFPGAEATVWYRRHAGSMSANLERQWRHDMEMHQRIARLVEAGAPGFADARGTRLLACCAGMLLTATRLGLPEAAPLLPWLERLFWLAARASVPGQGGAETLFRYFLARCRGLSFKVADIFPETLAGVVADGIATCLEMADCAEWRCLDATAMADKAASMGEALYLGAAAN